MLRAVLYFFVFVGSIIMAGAGIGPDEAIPNLTEWADRMGLPKLAKQLPPNIDNLVFIGGAILFAISLALLVRSFVLKRRTTKSSSFDFQIVSSPGQIDDYECACAVSVRNLESKTMTDCLVQIEEISRAYPEKMPVPLILRTRGQIDGKRSGRFTLSPNQPKTVPIIYRNPNRNNEWYFICSSSDSI